MTTQSVEQGQHKPQTQQQNYYQHQPNFRWVVLDSSPLLLNTVTPSISEGFVTIKEVIDEIIDSESKARVNSYLQGTSSIKLEISEPSVESMDIVRKFAKSSGDLASLSAVDLKLCALVVSMELECNGENSKMRKVHQLKKAFISATNDEDDVNDVNDINDGNVSKGDNNNPQSDQEEQEYDDYLNDINDNGNIDDGFITKVNAKALRREERKMSKKASNFEGDWITPEGLQSFITKASTTTTSNSSSLKSINSTSATNSIKKVQPSTRVGCISGDFAVQNIILLMKLPLLSIQNSKRIRQLKNWLLRCHACYKITKEMHKKFCPHCGNTTLIRTSYTLNSRGDIHLFLKDNFQYNLRGTKAPIPLPRSGQSSSIRSQAHGNGKDRRVLLLREDQKEMLRARKSQIWSENKAEKEARSDWNLVDDRLSTIFSNMEVCGAGGRSGGRGGRGSSTTTTSIMQPIIGFGRKNPNESRRKV